MSQKKKTLLIARQKKGTLKLDIFYPNEDAKKKRTAIIFMHGGGWRSGNKAMHYPLCSN